MELKFFTDLIDALGKVAAGLRALANIPKSEREKYRRTMDETYRLIDTTLNMVIIRLGNIVQPESDLLQEVMRLDNYEEWYQAEREFRLCKSLRLAFRETETLRGKLTGQISAKDWDALLEQMRSIFQTEGEVAQFVGGKFHELAESARNAQPNGPAAKAVRKQVEALRDALIKERQRLIQQEIELYTIV